MLHYITWIDSGKNLHARRSVSNDPNFLPTKVNVILPIRSMNKVAFEGRKTINIRPFPMTRA